LGANRGARKRGCDIVTKVIPNKPQIVQRVHFGWCLAYAHNIKGRIEIFSSSLTATNIEFNLYEKDATRITHDDTWLCA
jgi:hypothetical protein